jgi:hypothetical protein
MGWIRNFPIGLFKRLNLVGVLFSLAGRAKRAIMINEIVTATAPPEINSHKGKGRSYL